jgi:hypothetical protein
MLWTFPIELTEEEEALVGVLKSRSKFYVFLRTIRHLLFDHPCLQELEQLYSSKPRGVLPLPAGQLAMVTLLQAYEGVSDDEAVERATADARWRMVLDCAASEGAPFSKKALWSFRGRLVAHDMDTRLLDRTVELAQRSGMFDPKKLRALRLAMDSAPLEGAGRVEDTVNLVGRALKNLANVVAEQLQISQEQLAEKLGLELLGGQSIKAALDVDWNDARAKMVALRTVVDEACFLGAWTYEHAARLYEVDKVREALEDLDRVVRQDTESDPDGTGRRIKKGTAPDRTISLGDKQMRHGRKSKTKRIDGYKRYTSVDLDSKLTLATCVLPANVPERDGADKMAPQLRQHGEPAELHIDRAFLSSILLEEVREAAGKIVAKPYTGSNGDKYTKAQFEIDLERGAVTCPAGNTATIVGDKAKFELAACRRCAVRSHCQRKAAKGGRTISIHPQEEMFQELLAQVRTKEGRQKLRERTSVEHSLAHHCNRQGPRARYKGVRMNDFDAQRTCAVNNLFIIARRSHNGEELETMIEQVAA